MAGAPAEDRPLTDLSASRIRTADKCGLAFEYQYVRHVPAPYDRAATVFGNVIHDATEKWYGPPGSDQHKTTSLMQLVEDEWWEKLPFDVAGPLRKAIQAQRECDNVAQLIVITRPQIKAPQQTKAYLESPEFKRFEDARDHLLASSDKSEVMKWAANENALQAYSKSLDIAAKLERRWKHLPRPIAVEHPFDLEFEGIHIRGRIDQIRADPTPTGEVKVEGLDIKTSKQLMTQMEAFIQAFLYDEAARQCPELPIPDYWTFWMARFDKPQRGMIDYTRHAKLAKRIMQGVIDRIQRQDFTPHYGQWCKMCDFKDLCEAEIGLWPVGEDSMVLEMAV